MTQMTTPLLPKRLESIQALRGIAALLVMFFHMAAFQRQMAGDNAADIALTSGFWDQGWAGVDLFFVISGFIMVYVTRQTGRRFIDVRRFLMARITRIYPLWWVCAGIMAVYFWVTYGLPAAPDRIAGQSEAYSYAVKSFLLIPQTEVPILGLGWTLTHEMFFYIIFAAILFLPRKYLPAVLILWALVTLAGSQFIRPAAFGRTIPELMFSPLSLEFIAGGLAAYLICQKKIVRAKLFLLGGAVLAFLGLLLFPEITEASYTVSRVVVFTLPFVMLAYGWVGCEVNGTLGAPKWLSVLGDWSYSLYLTHYIVLITLRRLYRTMMPDHLSVGAVGVWDNIIFALLAVSISIIAAATFYRLIERPSLKFFKGLRG